MPLKAKSKIWIETENGILIGEGRYRLLKELHQTKSLNKAAKNLKMSYNKAWKLLKDMNTNSPQPISINQSGGKDGGGSEITDYAIKLIEVFESLNKSCWTMLDEEILKHDL